MINLIRTGTFLVFDTERTADLYKTVQSNGPQYVQHGFE